MARNSPACTQALRVIDDMVRATRNRSARAALLAVRKMLVDADISAAHLRRRLGESDAEIERLRRKVADLEAMSVVEEAKEKIRAIELDLKCAEMEREKAWHDGYAEGLAAGFGECAEIMAKNERRGHAG